LADHGELDEPDVLRAQTERMFNDPKACRFVEAFTDSRLELPDGRPFKDVRELKKLLVQDEAPIARNLVRQLPIFATGAPVRFSDRGEIERILDATRARHYGVRSIVHAFVQSKLLRNQ
jgi:hypothetical protein